MLIFLLRHVLNDTRFKCIYRIIVVKSWFSTHSHKWFYDKDNLLKCVSQCKVANTGALYFILLQMLLLFHFGFKKIFL